MAAAALPESGRFIDLGLQDCVIVVTGAGSGIGAATARLLGISRPTLYDLIKAYGLSSPSL